jgi:shikimate dehydrogenase
MITGQTRLYAIIGDPIAHVRTPMAFNDYFATHKIDAGCLPFHIERSDLVRGWSGLKSLLNLAGFIVTAPHKAEAAELCDELVGDGARARVVNAVRRDSRGLFVGTLLDGLGFVSGLKSKGHAVEGRRFYLVGAGGAGTALAYALAGSGAASLTIHNRTRQKAEKLASNVGAAFPNCAVRLGSANAAGHDVVINATSLGLNPDDGHSFDLGSADPDALVCEVVMKPEMTRLLSSAKALGHQVHFGTHMLNGQLMLMMDFLGLTQPQQSPLR